MLKFSGAAAECSCLYIVPWHAIIAKRLTSRRAVYTIIRGESLSLNKEHIDKTPGSGPFRRLAALLLCAALLLPLAGCAKDKSVQKQVFAMDTLMMLTAYGRKGDKGIAAAEDVIYSLDGMLDPENADSVVHAMDNANGQSVAVTPEIAEMLDTAKTVYERSNGALDLTVYPLVKLWGFIDSNFYVPTQEEIDAELPKLCFEDVDLQTSPDGDTVTMPADAQITFGAVAKGYTSDRSIAAMRDAGVTSAIISLGGNVQTLGHKPDGSNWNVAIQDPDDTSEYVGVLSVGETAVITSGNYERFFERDGVRYHHIIDPATGAPAKSGLKSVTIVCTSGVQSDCLSTALFVLGKDKALDYWRTYGGFELILIADDNEIICTKGLEGVFTLANENFTVSYTD